VPLYYSGVKPTIEREIKMNFFKRPRYIIAFVFTLLLTTVAVFAFTGGYSGDEYVNQEIFAEVSIPRGQSLEGAMPAEPSRDGYVFSHWSYSPDGEFFPYWQGLYDETTLYAVWHTYDQADYYCLGYIGDAPLCDLFDFDLGRAHDYAFEVVDDIVVRFMWNIGGY